MVGCASGGALSGALCCPLACMRMHGDARGPALSRPVASRKVARLNSGWLCPGSSMSTICPTHHAFVGFPFAELGPSQSPERSTELSALGRLLSGREGSALRANGPKGSSCCRVCAADSSAAWRHSSGRASTRPCIQPGGDRLRRRGSCQCEALVMAAGRADRSGRVMGA